MPIFGRQKKYRISNYFLGPPARRALIQAEIDKLIIPNDLNRKSFSLKHSANWKAAEYRDFFLYLALPILKDFLDPIQWWSLACFVYGNF